MAVLRDQALTCEIWVTSVDLVSEVNWLLDAQWVWENWVLLVETLHVWNQGQISNWLFCTICVYYEGQGSVIILCGAEYSEPLPSSLHCQNNWQNKVLIKWVVTYPGPNTQMLCVLGQVICSFLTWTWGPSYMSFLERITVHEHKEFTHLWSMVSIFHQNVLLQKTCIPIFLHPSKKNLYVKSWSFLLWISSEHWHWQMSFCPAEASAGRAGNFWCKSQCQYCLNIPLFQRPWCKQSEHTGGFLPCVSLIQHNAFPLFLLIVYFALEYSRLTILWQFQEVRKGTRPYIYMYPFSPKLSSHPGCHTTLRGFACANK